MPTPNESKLPVSDGRTTEFWLQDALELSLFERFCRSKEGQDRALILHTKRHGSRPDYALLDGDGKLILVELKRDRLTMNAAQQAVAQVVKYLELYPKLPLEELATWYCQHGVDVNSWFEYRGENSVHSGGADKSQYGRLNRSSTANINYYIKAAASPETAIAALREDYERIVERKTLDGLANDARFEVGRCIMAAEKWPADFEPEPVNGVKFELWEYPPLTAWLAPRS